MRNRSTEWDFSSLRVIVPSALTVVIVVVAFPKGFAVSTITNASHISKKTENDILFAFR